MKINLAKDVMVEIETVFAEQGVRYKPHSNLEKYLTDYLTLNKKLIFPVVRTVFISRQLQEALSTHVKKGAVAHIISLLQNGSDVNNFQSKRLFELNFHDHLLYDWNIHHFHLPQLSKKEKKTNSLLFAYTDDTQALLLDIDSHRDAVFADQKWLEIIYHNWPDVMEQWKIKGINDFHPKVNSAERMVLWNKGFNTGIVTIDGKFYKHPGLGKMLSGHSMEVVLQVDRVYEWIYRTEAAILENENAYIEQFSRLPLYDPSSFSVKAKITTAGIVVYETQIGKPLAQFP